MSRVSIITRTLDRPVLLARALQSILAQTFEDWLWVIVDAGHTGAVESLLEQNASALKGRVKHVHFTNPKPGMRGVPINAGIQASTTEYITLLDDDDTWHPDFLQKMVGALAGKPHENARGAVCRTVCLEESSVESGLKPLRSYILNEGLENISLPQLAIVNCFCTHAFVYERAALDAVGLYPEDYPVLEDWHFNLRFLYHHELLVVPEVLTTYHLRPPEVSASEANSQTAEKGGHKFHEARLINEAIREDIRAGKPGLGSILAQAALTRALNNTLHGHESRLKAIGDKTGKIDARTKALKDKLVGKD